MFSSFHDDLDNKYTTEVASKQVVIELKTLFPRDVSKSCVFGGAGLYKCFSVIARARVVVSSGGEAFKGSGYAMQKASFVKGRSFGESRENNVAQNLVKRCAVRYSLGKT